MSLESLPLPNELTFQIFSHLDVKSLVTATEVCKNWQKIANDECLWKLFLDKTSYLPPYNPDKPHFWKKFVIKSELGLFKLNLNQRFLTLCNESLKKSLPQIKQASTVCQEGLPLAILSPENCIVELEFLRMDEERNLAIFSGNHKFIIKNIENEILQEIPFPILAPAPFILLKDWAVFAGKKRCDKISKCYALNLKTKRVTRLIPNKKTNETNQKKTSNNRIRPQTFQQLGQYLSCKLGDSSIAFWKINPKSKCKTPLVVLEGIEGEINYLNVSHDKIIIQANNRIQIFSLASKELLYNKTLPDFDYLLDCKDKDLIFSDGQKIYHIDLSLEKIEEASLSNSIEVPVTNHKISSLCFAKNGYLWGTNWGAIFFNDLTGLKNPARVSSPWFNDNIKSLSSSGDFAAAIRLNTLLFINLRDFKTVTFEFINGEKVEKVQCLNSRLYLKTNYAYFCYDLDIEYLYESVFETALSKGKKILSSLNVNFL